MAAEQLVDSDVEKQQRIGKSECAGDGAFSMNMEISQPQNVQVVVVDCPAEPHRGSTSREECRVCQDDGEEALINLGCSCRGGLAKAHHSCIVKWFKTRGSNKCEICQQIAANVVFPISRSSYWTWRIDPVLRSPEIRMQQQQQQQRCFSPLWVAFSILIGGLVLDILISVVLGVSALPINIIIGVIVVLGLGTGLRLVVELCQGWNTRRVGQRIEAATASNLAYHPAL